MRFSFAHLMHMIFASYIEHTCVCVCVCAFHSPTAFNVGTTAKITMKHFDVKRQLRSNEAMRENI